MGKRSELDIGTEIRNRLLAQIMESPLVKESEISSRTDVSAVTFSIGDDENSVQRFATIKITLHKPTFTVDDLDELAVDYNEKMDERAARKATSAAKKSGKKSKAATTKSADE